MSIWIWLSGKLIPHAPGRGSLYLYTTELGTTPPPELSTSRLLYIRFRQNRLRYYMTNRTKVHHWLCRKMVLHGKQEYCTSQNKGILYITEIRNIVHHRKQEYCTSLKSGILYITEKKEFCTTQKIGILYNTEIRNIVHHSYDEECKWAFCCIVWCTVWNREKSYLSLLELNSTSKYTYNGEAKCHIKYCLKNVSLYLKNDLPTSIQIKFMIHLLHQVFKMRNFSWI